MNTETSIKPMPTFGDFLKVAGKYGLYLTNSALSPKRIGDNQFSIHIANVGNAVFSWYCKPFDPKNELVFVGYVHQKNNH